MGQSDIIKILDKLGHNQWLTSKEIAKKLNMVPHRVSTTIAKLRRYGEVESKVLPNAGQNREFEHRLTFRGRLP